VIQLDKKLLFHCAIAILLLIPGLVQASSQNANDEPRAALVIGNSSYQNGALRNPVNDARAVAASLEKLGFKVLLRENLNREGMHQSIDEFGRLLKDGGVGLFYYAGHGMQIKGRNFLIPVDADIQHEDDVEFRGMDANMVLSGMDAAHTRVNLLVLDACRNNPFARVSRSGNMGLAQMDAPKGTLIAFSTAPGSLAKDGTGTNSVYTTHLIEKLALPAMPVEQVFKEVRIAVTKETHDRQIPWESSSLMGDFYFVPPSAAITPTLAQVPLPEKSQAPTPLQTVEAHPPVVSTPAPEEIKHNKPANTGRDYNREGYEIELRAKNLTLDELPALEARAKQGDAIAQTTLGWAYLLGKGQLDGRGIPRINSKMISWTKAAAKQGYPVAQNNLGAIYMDGIGIKLNYPLAQHFYKLAADQGYLSAQRNLLQVSMMLSGKVDPNQLSDMAKTVREQWGKPVK
jgi:uncharacterized caspase-like protein